MHFLAFLYFLLPFSGGGIGHRKWLMRRIVRQVRAAGLAPSDWKLIGITFPELDDSQALEKFMFGDNLAYPESGSRQ